MGYVKSSDSGSDSSYNDNESTSSVKARKKVKDQKKSSKLSRVKANRKEKGKKYNEVKEEEKSKSKGGEKI